MACSRRRELLWLISLLVSLAASSCTVDGAERPDAELGDVPFYGDVPFITVDALLSPDGGGVDGGPSMGLQCQGCISNTDCAEGSYCTQLREGVLVCLEGCDRDLPDCPDRFECIDSLAIPLPEPVCTPVGERCCVDEDTDNHGVGVGCRGPDCNDADPLAFAGAAERCNGQDDDCDGMVDEGDPGAGVVCSTGMTGACSSGVTACVSGELLCQPPGGAVPETCNGVDDDCDADVDEDDMGRALTRSCYDGPAGTEGMGGCTAGVQTCAGGEYRGCVGQVLPGVEDCDGVDHDCDGMVDDGNPGGGFACASSAPGACGPGMTQCRGGLVSCFGTITPGTLPETCDTVDNDCDGMLNEGFPGLGGACTVGVGACRRGGVTSCDPTDPRAVPVCMGVAGTPAPAETCDYIDDDCDGTVDEGFRNAAGRYTAVTDCGACGFDCALSWPGGPGAFHVVPSCTVSGASTTCGFTCEMGWVDADRVRDNGCELFPEPDTIYVSTPANGGADVAGCGAWDAPCGSVGGGILRAVAAGRDRVRVSAGLYVGNVTLANGVSVLGGHSHVNWVRNTSVNTTVIRGASSASPSGGPNDRIVVSAISITSATELSGFSIEAIAAAPGGNSIGVYVRDSTNALLLQDNTIAAGTGGNGTNGTSGASGTVGAAGGAGAGPEARACGGAPIAGGVAGAGTCGGSSASGGAGGAGTDPVTGPGSLTRSGSGASGAGGGAGGTGGFHMEGSPTAGGGRTCTVYANPTDGAVGGAGPAGTDGIGGAGGSSSTGTVSGGQWRGVGGTAGGSATAGAGGGGGGSPAGVDANGSAYCLYPPSGGGGGAGGCQGTAGGPGGAGGASFGVFITHASAPTATTMPRLVNNRIRRASGGLGGDGGTGGGGGEGGAGGAGGPGASSDSYGFCLVAGAPGGVGGRGGHAGGGGAGAGGVSYDIWVSRPGTAMPDFSMNTFEIPAGTPTGGAGGTGGNSSNTALGIGDSGAAGAFGNTRVGT